MNVGEEKSNKLYVHAEFDSNQTLYEFVFNNCDLCVEADTKEKASVMLFLIHFIFDFFDVSTKNINDRWGEEVAYLFEESLTSKSNWHECGRMINKIIKSEIRSVTDDLTPQVVYKYPKKI